MPFAMSTASMKQIRINFSENTPDFHGENFKTLIIKDMEYDLNRWRAIPCLAGPNYLIMISVLLKAFYKFNEKSIKISVCIFLGGELDKLIPKF